MSEISYVHYAVRDGTTTELVAVVRVRHGDLLGVGSKYDEMHAIIVPNVRDKLRLLGYAETVYVDANSPMTFDDVQMLLAFDACPYLDYHPPKVRESISLAWDSLLRTLCFRP